MFKTRLDTFGNTFGYFGILKIFFLKIFENSTLHGTLGKKVSKNLTQNKFKSRLDTFEIDFGHFWNFANFLIFFFENFRRLDPPWNTGHKIFQKIFPKTCSKHVWILLGTLLGILDFENFWIFFEIFLRVDHPWKTGQKIFSKKIAPKHVQNMFGYFWERFWAFLEF